MLSYDAISNILCSVARLFAVALEAACPREAPRDLVHVQLLHNVRAWEAQMKRHGVPNLDGAAADQALLHARKPFRKPSE